MTKPWAEIRTKRINTPEQEADVAQRRQAMRHADRIAEIRQARNVTQGSIATCLGISQSGVSKLEAQDNVNLNTLNRYVAAMGGRIEIRAIFDNEEIAMKVRSADDFSTRMA